MARPPPQSTRTVTLFPHTALFRFGTRGLNARIEEALVGPRPPLHFHGRLLLVTENSYRHRLFNGDIGICLRDDRSEEHTSELQSLMRISYAVFRLKKKMSHKLHNNRLHKRIQSHTCKHIYYS